MARPSLLLLLAAAGLAACGDRAPADAGPPLAVAYAAACDPAHHARVLQVEGFLDLFPPMLYCAGTMDGGGPNCHVDLMPARLPPRTMGEARGDRLLLFVPEGTRPDHASAQGYGYGAPLRVFSADSALVDPGDRVRVTGRFDARPGVGADTSLTCAFSDLRIEVVERAAVTWADSLEAARQALQARADSMRVARERRDSLARHAH